MITSRRSVLALLLAISMVAAACGDDDGDAAGNGSDTTEPAVSGGDLVVAIGGLRRGFDPKLEGADIKNYVSPLYDPLIGLDDDGNPDPDTGLAEAWEYSDDDTVFTVTIREGVEFHNGDPLTAEDVQFTVERILEPDSVASWAATLRVEIESIEVVDDHTVRFNLTRPRPLFHFRLSRLDGMEGYVVPKAYVEGGGDLSQDPVGTGPYMLDSIAAGGDTKIYTANPNYWRGAPRYDRIIYNNVEEASTRINQLRAGEVDFIDVPRDQADSVEALGFNIISSPVTSPIELWPMNQWQPPFDDVRVREALNLAIDRDTLIATIFSERAEPANFYPMMSVAVGYAGPADIPHDPDRARELIEEAGATGENIELIQYGLAGVAEAPQLLQAVAGYWDAIGLRTQIVPDEYTNVRPRMADRDDELAGKVGWMRDAPLRFPDSGMRILMHSEGVLTLHQDPQLDALIEAVESAVTEEEYIEAFQTAVDYTVENWLRVPIAEVQQLYAANADKVPADYNMGPYTSDVYLRGLFFDE